jgi:alcohol dehydrogenase (cytochrome c)
VGLFLTTYVIAQDTDWAHYGGNPWNERHATLTKITTGNVAHLVPRRVLQLGHVGTSLSASPLVVDGVLYVSAPDGIVQAFDLRTGMRKWTFQHNLDLSVYPASKKPSAGGARAPACCSNTSRGLAYADGTIYLGTLDAKMIANGTCGALHRNTTRVVSTDTTQLRSPWATWS